MGIREDNNLIRLIADRASRIYRRYEIKVEPEYIASELKICHEEICPLRLDALLDADDVNFAHDIGGIHEHLDILNGIFREEFSPRFKRL